MERNLQQLSFIYPVFTTMETVEVATEQNFWRFNFYGPYGKYWIEMIVNDSFQMAQVIRFLGHFQTIKLTDSIFFSENKYFFFTVHTVQKLRVISNKCPRTFDSCFSLYGIGTSIKTLK